MITWDFIEICHQLLNVVFAKVKVRFTFDVRLSQAVLGELECWIQVFILAHRLWAFSVELLASVAELLLVYLGAGEGFLLVVFAAKFKDVWFLTQLGGRHFDNWQDGGLVEILSERHRLPGVTEIVAPGEKVADLELALVGAEIPQVLAQASFGGYFTIVREMVVELILIDFHV